MPAVNNVVINDGATTPVAHTFSPLGRDTKGVMWFEQTSPVPVSPLGAKRIGYRQVRSTDPKGALASMSKVTVTMSVPTLEVLGNSATGITPPPTLAYVELCRLEFSLAERSTTQERKDLRSLLGNFVAHAMIIAAVDTLQPTY